MEKNRKYFYLIGALVLVALVGYFVVGGGFNSSTADAAGSGIEGVKKAKKYRSGNTAAALDLDGEDVQQLLQNDDFQRVSRYTDVQSHRIRGSSPPSRSFGIGTRSAEMSIRRVG